MGKTSWIRLPFSWMLIYEAVKAAMLAVVLLHQGEKIELEGRGHPVEPKNEAHTTECTIMKLGESGSSVTSSESDFSVM